MKKYFLFSLFIVMFGLGLFSQQFATVTQSLRNQEQLAGKEFRYSAYVKVEKGAKGNGALWFRVDKPNRSVGFFDNMNKRPITSSDWNKYEITGTIDKEVKNIYFGCMLEGEGKLWVDNILIEYKNNQGEWIQFEIINSGFEEFTDNLPLGWYAFSDGYSYTCDTVNAKEGHFSMRIESNPEEIKTKTEFVKNGIVIKLPAPRTDSKVSVESALLHRRSIRQYAPDSLTLADVSQMLWAAWGISDSTTYKGFYLRTTPSAGALYPFEVYLVAGKIISLDAGVYKYNAFTNSLIMLIKGDIRSELCKASYQQTFIKKGAASIVWTAIFERTTSKYKTRGKERYVCMDLGHSGENVYLQAETLGLGTCAIGAFEDVKIVKLFDLPKEEEPLYIMPFGKLTKEDLEHRAKK